MVKVERNGDKISIVLETEDEMNTMWHSLNMLHVQERYEVCNNIRSVQYDIFSAFYDEYCPDEV